jgi:hypothetical protein
MGIQQSFLPPIIPMTLKRIFLNSAHLSEAARDMDMPA